MRRMLYYWSKIMKKMRGCSISNSIIPPSSKVEAGSNIINTRFGKHSFCGYNCEISNAEIGSFCSIASNVVIGGGTHPMDWVSMSPVFYQGKDSVKAKFHPKKRPLPLTTIIGSDVWIGEKSLIKQGVSIGNGAVIGMGSVVTRDVQPYSIVAGVPAKEIRKRFEESIIQRLQKSEWWSLEDKQILELAENFDSPEKFLKSVGQ